MVALIVVIFTFEDCCSPAVCLLNGGRIAQVGFGGVVGNIALSLELRRWTDF